MAQKNKNETQPKQMVGIETGVVALDLVLGGYLPLGKIIELNGESAVGKSTLALYAASKLCKQNLLVYYFDAERGVTEKIMKNMGLLEYLGSKFILDQETSLYSELQAKMDELLGKDPKDRTKKPVRHEKTPDVIILDSQAMIVPDGAKEKDIESNVSNNMIAARYATQFFKDIVGDLAEVNTTYLFINHTQVKMKKVGFGMTVPYQDSAGSSMIKYGPDIRLYIGDSKELKVIRNTIVGKQEARIGAVANIWTKKSRVEDNCIKLPIKLLDAFGVFNGYTLRPICENLGWITGASGHYYVQSPIIPPDAKKTSEKGYYLSGTDAVEIFCQQNAGIIVKALKETGNYMLTLDRKEHGSMLDIIQKSEVKK